MQTFFPNKETKYFTVIDNNPSPSNSEKMNLLNQMLESAKLKDKELNLERDIVKEDKGRQRIHLGWGGQIGRRCSWDGT